MNNPVEHDDEDDLEVSVKIPPKILMILSAVFLTLIAIGGHVWVSVRAPKITPEEVRNGWSAEAVESEEVKEFVGSLPDFLIVGDDKDHTRDNVRLWDAVIAVRGTHFENTPQQIGDCVSWGMKHAIEYLQCVEMKTGPPREFHHVFSPFIYGVSRHQIGQDRYARTDGSCMAWAVRAVQEYGVLRADEAGVPPYSGAIARAWGSRTGPPPQFLAKARQFLVKTVSQVRTADAIRDSICNRYPVPFGAGNIGFNVVREKYGRLVASNSGVWAHAQCVIGYDGSAPEPLFCILNSWGPFAAGKSPIDGSPPGSYWITKRDMDFIARQGDAFAISNFDGFKARNIDFKLIQKPQKKGMNHAVASSAL